MWEQQVAFWILAIAMCAAAIGVVRTKNVVHAALFLVVVLAGAAAQYILLAAEFVAWVQVLIYIGAVVILFLFGIMLTRAPMGGEGRRLDNDQRWGAVVVALFVFGVLTAMLVDAFGGDEIRFFIEGYASGAVPDYQAAALAMAVFFRGMTPAEIGALCESMMRTGEVLDLSDLPGPKVDKHSTGGVGDKTSLILAPLAAADAETDLEGALQAGEVPSIGDLLELRAGAHAWLIGISGRPVESRRRSASQANPRQCNSRRSPNKGKVVE